MVNDLAWTLPMVKAIAIQSMKTKPALFFVAGNDRFVGNTDMEIFAVMRVPSAGSRTPQQQDRTNRRTKRLELTELPHQRERTRL